MIDFCGIRHAMWRAARSRIAEGSLLPTWLLAVRALLFPLDFFYWRMSKTRGYQLDRDVWLIEGVEYSGVCMRYFAEADGEVFRVVRTGPTVTLERVKGDE